MISGWLLWISFVIDGQPYESTSRVFTTREECEVVREHIAKVKTVIDSECYSGLRRASK